MHPAVISEEFRETFAGLAGREDADARRLLHVVGEWRETGGLSPEAAAWLNPRFAHSTW